MFCTFNQCRDLENKHHEKLRVIVLATQKKLDMDPFDESLPDDVQKVRAPKQFISVRE